MQTGDDLDPKTLSIAELLEMAEENEAGSFVIECKDEASDPIWAVIALHGEGVDELIEAVQAALEAVHARWDKEDAENAKENPSN